MNLPLKTVVAFCLLPFQVQAQELVPAEAQPEPPPAAVAPAEPPQPAPPPPAATTPTPMQEAAPLEREEIGGRRMLGGTAAAVAALATSIALSGTFGLVAFGVLAASNFMVSALTRRVLETQPVGANGLALLLLEGGLGVGGLILVPVLGVLLSVPAAAVAGLAAWAAASAVRQRWIGWLQVVSATTLVSAAAGAAGLILGGLVSALAFGMALGGVTVLFGSPNSSSDVGLGVFLLLGAFALFPLGPLLLIITTGGGHVLGAVVAGVAAGSVQGEAWPAE